VNRKPKDFFTTDQYYVLRRFSMDKASKTQLSIILFVIGIICLIIPYLKGLETIPIGISQYIYIFFYLGLILIVIGYYLK